MLSPQSTVKRYLPCINKNYISIDTFQTLNENMPNKITKISKEMCSLLTHLSQKVLLISFLTYLSISCFHTSSKALSKKNTVSFTWHEKAESLIILAKDIGLSPRILPRGPFPYSDNKNTAIWVGIDFPYKQAVQMILWSRKYFKELRYFALSDYVSSYTDRYDKNLFIGGSTRKALKLKLVAWTKKDFAKLKKIKSQKAFHKMIRKRYPKVLTKRKKSS